MALFYFLLRLFSFCLLLFLARFAYIITTVKDQSCESLDLCFFPRTINRRSYYASVFQDLITEGFLSINSTALCIATQDGMEIDALKEIGVLNSTGIASSVLYVEGVNRSFKNQSFDFIFLSADVDRISQPVHFAFEVSRTLKSGGYFVVHTASASDAYSFDSLVQLLDTFTLMKSHEIDGLDSSLSWELVFKRENKIRHHTEKGQMRNGMIAHVCLVPRHMLKLIENAEPLIKEEPSEPWMTLKRNMKNVIYLPRMVDISFRNRYVYVDVGAKNYDSSIDGWFKKRYPKQGKTFEIYAVEVSSAFHDQYISKKGVTLLPYAAWVRNETLFFEINRVPRRKSKKWGRGTGRPQSVQSASNFISDANKIRGFDFAMWLKSSVTDRDYVVVKIDIEGIEFHLIPRLIETRAACLIDEMFLECHYEKWERYCPEKGCPKYQKTYAQCLELFTSLRKIGVLVHQWC